MIHELAQVCRPTRLRAFVLAALAVFATASCNDTEPLAPETQTDMPTTATTLTTPAADSATVATSTPAGITYAGVPFGPFGLWNSYTTVEWGPAPFTASHNYVGAGGIITFISAARLKKQRLMLAMTGGPSWMYTTNGKFDYSKWQAKMKTFNTTAIKNAVAAAVADGTIVGNSVIDEPSTKQWGGVVSKAVLDKMAAYVKSIFPTLPVGVNFGPNYFDWRTSERFHTMDYVLNQYQWYATNGDAGAFRDKVKRQASLDGVKVGFSLNLLSGGIPGASCAAGRGPKYPQCRMTADQVTSWGRTLGVAGCTLMMYKYDDAFMSKSTNVQAFKDVASTLASTARPVCK